jgi:putative PIN family toxin of toxin-antitoxin system
MKADPKRVVVDTNVWISAALSPSGTPAQVVRRVLANAIPVLSEPTFAELEHRLWLPKFDRYLSMEVRHAILHDLSAAAHWAEIPPDIGLRKHCRDADDDKFIHAALAANAAWLVTGDRDLLVVPAIAQLQILSPSDALNQPNFPG